TPFPQTQGASPMQRVSVLILVLCACIATPRLSHAFCGFYVASGDAKLYNRASQVALVRDGDRTVMTLANDFKGEPKEFAIVVPVPTVLEKGQIHVADRALVEHLDSFTAPRLVEYFDEDPCAQYLARDEMRSLGAAAKSVVAQEAIRANS